MLYYLCNNVNAKICIMVHSQKSPVKQRNWARLKEGEKVELLVEIARAYYEQNHDQGMIAQSLGISRSQVSRYLTQAKELNLVQVRVISPNERISKVETALKKQFDFLKEAIVVPVFKLQEEQLRKTIARACAHYLEQVVRPGLRICVGSGRTLCEVCKWLRPTRVPNISIVQAMGNVGHEAMDIDFNQMARAAANAFGAKVSFLNAPAILGSGTVKELIDANPTIHEALKMAHSADLYLFGIGSLTSDLIFTRGGIFTLQDLEQLRQAGSIGDICARFFNINGIEIPSSFEDRIVGITLDDLHSDALTIAVAGGADKVLPLIGALHGNWIKVLITDEQTAGAILDYESERRRSSN
jgi:DNA-binding transcriptional regulator LsrR (DeoR family)